MVKQKKHYEDWQAKLGTTSFDPLDAMTLADAVRVRAKTVALSVGTFKLRYQGHTVHYSPERGFTPCGFINIEQIEREG